MNFWTFWTVFMVSETLVFRVFLIKIGKGCSEIVENLKKHRIILPLQGCSWILVKFLSFLNTKNESGYLILCPQGERLRDSKKRKVPKCFCQ